MCDGAHEGNDELVHTFHESDIVLVPVCIVMGKFREAGLVVSLSEGGGMVGLGVVSSVGGGGDASADVLVGGVAFPPGDPQGVGSP